MHKTRAMTCIVTYLCLPSRSTKSWAVCNACELYALLTTQHLLEQTQPGLLDTHLKPLKIRIEKILANAKADSGEIAKRVRILRMAGCWMMAATNCTSPMPTRANG